MNDLLHRPGMIPAILLSCASVAAILWVALAALSPRVPQPAKSPVIHAYLLPVIILKGSQPAAARSIPPRTITPTGRRPAIRARPSWPQAAPHRNWPGEALSGSPFHTTAST